MSDFADSMGELITIYGLPFGRDLASVVQVYRRALADLTDAEMDQAVRWWIGRESAFPKPAQLRQALESARQAQPRAEYDAGLMRQFYFWRRSARLFLDDPGSGITDLEAMQDFEDKIYHQGKYARVHNGD